MRKDLSEVLNRLCKWRTVFASWQLGTRLQSDGECQAVRDHREVTLLLRVEQSALAKLLLDKGVFTMEEWEDQLIEEAEAMEAILERRFPGFQATPYGLKIDAAQAAETSKEWPP